MATPDQCKRQIRDTYEHLMARVNAGKMNRGAVDGIIESHCRDAARHNGIPGYWREYLPDELKAAPTGYNS